MLAGAGAGAGVESFWGRRCYSIHSFCWGLDTRLITEHTEQPGLSLP